MNERYTHIDLFSGIGGFSLAAQWNGVETRLFVELDPFCQKILRKNFPDVPIHDDIKTFHWGESCQVKDEFRPISKTAQKQPLQGSLEELFENVSVAEKPFPSHQAFLKKEVAIAPGNVAPSQCEEAMDQTLGAVNGCEAQTIQTIKMEQGMTDCCVTTKTRSINGEDRCTQETTIPARSADISQDERTTLTHTISKPGANSQKEDLMSQTESRSVDHATRENTVDRVWLLTAGVPCQPASCAGKRRGTKDDRWLWGETFRVIREVMPTWCILENVRGILSLEGGLVFENLCLELESIGYEVQPIIIPACAKGAPHRRDRVWIVANAKSSNARRKRSGDDKREILSSNGVRLWPQSSHTDINAHNPQLSGCKGSTGRTQTEQDRNRQEDGLSKQTDCHAADTRCFRQTVSQEQAAGIKQCFTRNTERGQLAWAQDGGLSGRQSAYSIGSHWNEPWLEVATRLCSLDDGLPPELARPRGWRVNALKALGNSIVPQIAYEIIRAMKESI